MVGKTLGHYEILEPLGKGGMGEVYRARDTKLDRDVAIKVLPEDFATDPERLARFEREAKLLASLNHANIAAIYGLEDEGDQRFIVMEVVEGETLAERIAKSGRIEVDEALEIARQIAEALEAAHENGVIHRDLKPANVIVTPDGKVKVLDFGLAKAYEMDGSPSEISPDLSHSPTMAAATRTGVIMGTAAYMSPEQARGRAVDMRTDIWAFGAVVYEMLAGRRAFGGETVSDTMAAILKEDPDWSFLPAATSAELRWLLRWCLTKEAKRRLQHIGDARVMIGEILNGESSLQSAYVLTSSAPAVTWKLAVPAALALLLLGAAITWVVIGSGTSRSDPQPVRFSFPVSPIGRWRGALSRLAISPGGERIAYVDNDQLYLRERGEFEGISVQGSEGASAPFFSPGGDWVGFVANGRLYRAPVAGGTPFQISRVAEVLGAAWTDDDTIIFGGGVGQGLFRVPVTAGDPEPLTVPGPERGEVNHGFPQVLPDGRTVIFTVGTGTGSRLAKLSLDSPDEWQELWPPGTGPSAAGAQYVAAGYLVFSQGGNLRLAPFDLETGEVTGDVYPGLDGVRWENMTGLELAAFAVSPSGDLVYEPGGRHLGLTIPVWVDREGNETAIEARPATHFGARISPGGQQAALNGTAPGGNGVGEIWLLDLGTDQVVNVGGEGAANYNPLWTIEGTGLIFTKNGNIFEILLDSTAAPELFLERENLQMPQSWSWDGQFLAFVDVSVTGLSLWVMPRQGDPVPLTDSSYDDLSEPRFSPVGDWLAYVATASGRSQVFVRRYPGDESPHPVAVGVQPTWSRDGTELFYRDADRMMAVAIQTEPDFDIGDPVELWAAPQYFSMGIIAHDYDVADDGRFLMLKSTEDADVGKTQINVVLNWFEELKQRVPTGGSR